MGFGHDNCNAKEFLDRNIILGFKPYFFDTYTCILTCYLNNGHEGNPIIMFSFTCPGIISISVKYFNAHTYYNQTTLTYIKVVDWARAYSHTLYIV